MILSQKQCDYFARAIEASNNSPCHVQHGAVLVVGGKIINAACNTMQPSYLSKSNTQHAEDAVLYRSLRATGLQQFEKGPSQRQD